MLAEVRSLCIAQFTTIMSSWNKNELDVHFDLLLHMLKSAMNDSDPRVRTNAREAFCMFGELW